jgi:uncharacterized protein YjbI with pentapeptide repeats
MADQQQLEIIRQGAEVWNEWRKKNPELILNLGRANLSGAYLSESNLSGANLSGANLYRVIGPAEEKVKELRS